MIKLFSYLSIYYFRGQRYKLILNLQTLSKFLCFQLLIIAQDDVGGDGTDAFGRTQITHGSQRQTAIDLIYYFISKWIFISFITERNEAKKGAKTLLRPFGGKRHSRALSSEAGTQILQITQCARICRFACEELATLKQHFVFRCSDCSAIRDSISIQRICIPLKTSSCGMFSLES